jgi:hypothetical protein
MDIEAMRKAMLEVIPRFHAENLRALELGYSRDEAMSLG